MPLTFVPSNHTSNNYVKSSSETASSDVVGELKRMIEFQARRIDALEARLRQEGSLQSSDPVDQARKLAKQGIPVGELRHRGFTAWQLMQAGFDPAELIEEAGFSLRQLREARADAVALRLAGYSAAELRKVGYPPRELAQAGYGLKDLLQLGYTPTDLKCLGYDTEDLQASGLDPATLRHSGYSIQELRQAGFSWADLNRTAGIPLPDLIAEGYVLAPGTKVSTEHGDGQIDGPPCYNKYRVKIRNGFSSGASFFFDAGRLRLA